MVPVAEFSTASGREMLNSLFEAMKKMALSEKGSIAYQAAVLYSSRIEEAIVNRIDEKAS